jgi:type IV secretory pathway protease TraF
MNTQATERGPFERNARDEQWQPLMHRPHRPEHARRVINRINGFIFTLILLLILFVILGMACNRSPSVPVGLYRLVISPPARGQYVVLAMPIKLIAGMPGDWITTTPSGTYINGKLIPNSAPLLSPHYPFGTFELGPSSLWLVGKDPRSWDSRYFGPIPETLINATAEPIWVHG